MAFRVLVVDDASFVRDTIKRNLRPLIPDVEIIEAIDGRKAVSAMKTNVVDLILSDWEMPEMSGEEFLRWLRAQPGHESTPFIMVSSRGDRDHVIAAVNSGVSDYLTKPFTPEELHKKVAKQLKRVGYRPPGRASAAAQSGFSSLDVLTGSKKATIEKPREVRSAAGFGKPAPKAKPAVARGGKASFQGRAFLRFPNSSSECEIRELSLQALNGVMERPDKMPAVFDQAAVDLENAKGEAMARLNGYVHAVLASEPRPDSQRLKITVRFVDNDPEKFEALSKAIAGAG